MPVSYIAYQVPLGQALAEQPVFPVNGRQVAASLGVERDKVLLHLLRRDTFLRQYVREWQGFVTKTYTVRP